MAEKKETKNTAKKTNNAKASSKSSATSKTGKENITKKTNNTAKKSVKEEEQEEKKKTNTKNGAKKTTKKPATNTKKKAETDTDNVKKAVAKKENKDTNKETAIKEKKPEEIQEAVAKELKANKKIPSEELGKINKCIFQNICLAIVIMFFFNFIILGFINIENNVFITDLKVFSMAILIVAIGIFEYAYKKDSGKYAIHGIEILVLAFVTMALIYVDLMWADRFIYIVAFITYVFAIYYVAKSIVIYNKMKKEYFLGEMKEIIKVRS